MIQHMQINKCNNHINKMKDKNHMIISTMQKRHSNILLMCCWIRFVSILLEDLHLYSSEILVYSLLFLKSTYLAMVSWYYCSKNKFGIFLRLQFFGRILEGLALILYNIFVRIQWINA